MIAGANKDDYHLRNVTPGEDFAARIFRFAAGGEGRHMHAMCGAPLEMVKTVEIGHIFKLGYRYSESMGLRVLGEDGQRSRRRSWARTASASSGFCALYG